MPYGAPYKAVGGTIVFFSNSNGHPAKITSGSVRRVPLQTDNTTGPGDDGNPTFCKGNVATYFSLRGHHAAGVEATGVSYTHSSKSLSSVDSPFANVGVGDQLYISGGTNATVGLYTIATKISDGTVTLATAPGTGDQSDFVLDGGPTLGDIEDGAVTIQLGTGQIVSGTGIMQVVQASAAWDGGGVIPFQVNGVFTGAVTWSRPS